MNPSSDALRLEVAKYGVAVSVIESATVHRAAECLEEAQPISHNAACEPVNGSSDSRTEATVNTTKPRL